MAGAFKPKFAHWLPLVRAHRGAICLCTVLLLAEGVVALTVPEFTRDLVQSVLSGQESIVGLLIAVLGALLLAQSALAFAGSYLQGAVGEDILSELRLLACRAVQRMSLERQEKRPDGELLRVVIDDTKAVSSGATQLLVRTLPSFVVALGAGFMLLSLIPVLGVVAASVIALLVGLQAVVGRRLRPSFSLVHRLEAEGKTLAEMQLCSIKGMRALASKAALERYFDAHRFRARLAGKRHGMANALVEPAGQVAGGLAVLAVLWMLPSGLVRPALDAPALVSLCLYGMLLKRSLGALVNLHAELQGGFSANDRIRILLTEPEVPIGAHAPEPATVRGRLALKRLCFAYPRQRHLWSGLELEIGCGEVVGVTGPSGIGKTTLLHLLLGLRRPVEGGIFLDGVEIGDWNVTALHRSVALVPDAPLFLPLSVQRNLTLDDDVPDTMRLERALSISTANEVVERLPGGLNAMLGLPGSRVSAGEAQRLSLARGLYREPSVLLVDESTSLFDVVAEARFVGQMRAELANTTVLLVTDRPETLAIVDRVLRLDAPRRSQDLGFGQVIEGPWGHHLR